MHAQALASILAVERTRGGTFGDQWLAEAHEPCQADAETPPAYMGEHYRLNAEYKRTMGHDAPEPTPWPVGHAAPETQTLEALGRNLEAAMARVDAAARPLFEHLGIR